MRRGRSAPNASTDELLGQVRDEVQGLRSDLDARWPLPLDEDQAEARDEVDGL